MRHVATVALVLAVIPAATGQPDRAAAELARLEGPWVAVKVQVGKKAVDLTALEWSVRFHKGRWAMVNPEGKAEGKVVLDTSRTPHRLDLVAAKGTLFCTYAIEKDQLRLCWWDRAQDRQDTLDPTKQQPPGVLLVMRRPKDGPTVNVRLDERP